jgi:hypothetical protein
MALIISVTSLTETTNFKGSRPLIVQETTFIKCDIRITISLRKMASTMLSKGGITVYVPKETILKDIAAKME